MDVKEKKAGGDNNTRNMKMEEGRKILLRPSKKNRERKRRKSIGE